MLTAIISDVHGNLPALQKALEDCKHVDAIINLGDVVNYGPWGNECVDLLSSINIPVVNLKGNHEQYFLDGKCECTNEVAKSFFEVCYPEFNRLKTISSYNNNYKFNEYIAIHTLDNRYLYNDSEVILNGNYIIGHSHQQYIKKHNGYNLVNPGSIGQNRQFINNINYIIYDDKKKYFDMKSIQYDIDIVINEFKSRCYP